MIRVIDGDTVKVRLESGARKNVRIIGIDSPEATSTRTGAPDCGGRQAAAALRKVLPVGKRVRIASDPTQDLVDRFQRLLRYVHADGRDVGRRQVRIGWAAPYVFEKPFERTNDYTAAAAAARQERRGVHSACAGNFHTSRGA